ncbi:MULTISPECIES: hypothetical protein [unclassified Micromonospora]|uniref:hypothetical protein n=1 Tax=unclassified Micromonospora TaxID=2617518 RepID=UPI00188DC9D5|nr:MULTISPECIES: hypothetical protein [unclassified Micromonospora]MBF5029191.1 hypothetical protein [Micromonospora sp. ANENR4]MCZ7475678.1 hypothetical protein [Micromonospora sp. WMMC273]WBC00548.1 hypothetical protein O7546_15340 [Micromonospora sp. WMMA1976]
MSTALPVVRARWCDIGRIADLVAEALAPTALAAWLVPDTSRRLPVLAAVARIWTEHALLFGDAFLLPDGSAATVWFHRYRPIPAPHRYADRLAGAAGPDEDRFRRLGAELAARRPAEPHNHLALLAAPRGGATQALSSAQRRMDTLSLPTYAHPCAGEQTEELLRRHGYAERETFAAPDGTPVRSLWRSAPFHAGGNDRWRTRRAARRERDGRAAGRAAR